VTRIIAGALGGRSVKVPRGTTRPTSERVREALFSALESRLGGAGAWAGVAVADLYAGSGALAFEALSRGAGSAALVESSRAAAGVVRANAAALGLGGRVSVLCAPVERALAGGSLRRPGGFGVVFLDPPYALADAAVDAVLGALADGVVAPGAVVALERPTRAGRPAWPGAWAPEGARSYGDTTLHLARAPAPEEPERMET
jgi:16S rRNA (guanine966-N2)-methyltransferase